VTPPATTGFGTRLIEFAASRELGGRVELDYLPSGLTVEILLPIPRSVWAALVAKTILIVEDEVLIRRPTQGRAARNCAAAALPLI